MDRVNYKNVRQYYIFLFYCNPKYVKKKRNK